MLFSTRVAVQRIVATDSRLRALEKWRCAARISTSRPVAQSRPPLGPVWSCRERSFALPAGALFVLAQQDYRTRETTAL
jgi:hypothetical protein